MTVITLAAADGHRFEAYRAEPASRPKGSIVIVHEILGVTPYIERVCARFAAAGYTAVAPALFDRFERGAVLDIGPKGVARGRALRELAGFDTPLADIAATAEALRRDGPVSVVGFCWGGTLAWRAVQQPGFDAAICYYGGQIADFLDPSPCAPVMLHFGALDPMIGFEVRETIGTRFPMAPLHLYPAGHAFDNDMRDDHDSASGKLAHQRTLNFLDACLDRRHFGTD